MFKKSLLKLCIMWKHVIKEKENHNSKKKIKNVKYHKCSMFKPSSFYCHTTDLYCRNSVIFVLSHKRNELAEILSYLCITKYPK